MNNFCGNCGSKYLSLSWPRDCQDCGMQTWKNPTPVVFVLQPISDKLRLGLAIARRAHDPCAGEWSFVGGFVDMTDQSLVEAARREFREETSLEIASELHMVYSELNSWGQMIIAVETETPISLKQWQTAQPCSENLELGVLWPDSNIKLCFPVHQKIAERWFYGVI